MFATPCHIYSVSKYIDLHKLSDKVLFVDIFCHGCPSLNLWKKYLEYSKKIFSIREIDKINFRSKPYGWHEFNITFIAGDTSYHSPRKKDPFHEMFFKKNVLNEACYACKLRSTIAYTDIRIGDFWGKEYSQNIEGVSVVVINTDKGKVLFASVKDRFEIKNHSLSEVVPLQSYGKKHKLDVNMRRHTLDLLSSESISEENITLGNAMKYKIIIRKYKIVDNEALKTIVKTNRKRYKDDRKHLREKRMKTLIENVKESNGFG